MQRQPYIVQGPNFACLLAALCNFLRWTGRETPEPGDEEWEDLVDFSGSRNGSATRFHEVAELLGIKILMVPYEYAIEHAPAIVSVENPIPGSYLHAVFVAPDPKGPIAVNHWWLRGPVESPVDEMIPFTRFGNYTLELVAEPKKAPPRPRSAIRPVRIEDFQGALPMGQFIGLPSSKRWLH